MTDSNIDQTTEENVLTLERRGTDRRSESTGTDEGNSVNLETGVVDQSRRKKQRRRHIDPTTCERDYSNPEIEFMRAMDDYKHDAGRMFPTCSEVLEVIRSLGYYKLTAEEIVDLGFDDISNSDAQEDGQEGAQEMESGDDDSNDYIDA